MNDFADFLFGHLIFSDEELTNHDRNLIMEASRTPAENWQDIVENQLNYADTLKANRMISEIIFAKAHEAEANAKAQPIDS
jgi:hypothetical protein